ncbi:efflux RND transporter periplasmic adaptor subunit [Mesorhizobium atlanticum]
MPGYLQEQTAADGSDVKQGDMLYRIAPDDYQAALSQAKAQVQRDTATLEYAKVQSRPRHRHPAKAGYLDKDGFDQRTSNLRAAQAALAVDQAGGADSRGSTSAMPRSRRRSRAASAAARLRSARWSVSPARCSYAGAARPDLCDLQSERDRPGADRAGERPVRSPSTCSCPARRAAEPEGRELTFIDNTIDHSTGTITARATIGNAKFTLLPGQYVRVRLHVKEQPNTLMVPQVALGSSQLGKYLYVIGKGNTVDQKLVSLGPTDGDLISVTSGISETGQVITGNLQKIGPGMPVSPLPQPKPAS